MKKKTKLKDIADTLNISIATVSRALNNKEDINPKTKREILMMAAELDYKSSKMAVSLNKHKTNNVIGVVMPSINHYFFAKMLQGIMKKAHLNNYLVIVGESQDRNKTEKQVLEEFMEHGVNGILLAPCLESDFDNNLLPLIHRRIPIVVIDRNYDKYSGNYVLNDDYHGSYIAVKHLIECGYQHIAHIGITDSRSIGVKRKKGYMAALKSSKIEINNEHIILIDLKDPELSVEQGYIGAKKLFELEKVPDAIFAVTDDVAIGIYKYAKEHGIKIPQDLGVVGFSNSLLSQHVTPPLTTVEQKGAEMGAVAFDYLIQALHTQGSVFQKTFESKLLVRGSTINQ